MITRIRARTAALLGAALIGVVLLGLPSAGAHDGRAVFTVEQAEPDVQLGIRYVVRVTWDNDGHAALDATVTATALGANGVTATPVPLQPIDGDGRYQAIVAFPTPGSWTVRFTSITPPGTAERMETVTGAGPTSATPETSATVVTIITTVAVGESATPVSGATAPASSAASIAAATIPSSPQSEAGNGGGDGAWLLGGVLVALLVIIIPSMMVMRAQRRGAK